MDFRNLPLNGVAISGASTVSMTRFSMPGISIIEPFNLKIGLPTRAVCLPTLEGARNETLNHGNEGVRINKRNKFMGDAIAAYRSAGNEQDSADNLGRLLGGYLDELKAEFAADNDCESNVRNEVTKLRDALSGAKINRSGDAYVALDKAQALATELASKL